jgi:uncharacterized protein YxjI
MLRMGHDCTSRVSCSCGVLWIHPRHSYMIEVPPREKVSVIVVIVVIVVRLSQLAA